MCAYVIFSYFLGYFFLCVACLRACNVTYAALFKQRTKKGGFLRCAGKLDEKLIVHVRKRTKRRPVKGRFISEYIITFCPKKVQKYIVSVKIHSSFYNDKKNSEINICFMSLVAHRFGRVEFRIFVFIFSTVPA